jgi:DNA-directed RNA polymerase subunit RPC12/RpoP
MQYKCVRCHGQAVPVPGWQPQGGLDPQMMKVRCQRCQHEFFVVKRNDTNK